MGSSDRSVTDAARPALAIEGRLDKVLAGRLIELLVHEDVHGLCRCEAVFNNWGDTGSAAGHLYFDRQVLDFGKRLEVRLGSDTSFDGRIFALQADFPGRGRSRLRVLAEDALQDLRMTRRSRSFADVSDADVFRQVARDHGLTARVDELAGPTHKILAQLNQSDLAFLRERARALGAEVRVRGTTLEAGPRLVRSTPVLTLTQDIGLQAFRVTADLADQATAVVVSGWDVSAKQAINEVGDDSALAGELGNDESAAAILKTAFSERRQTCAHAVPLSAGEARAQARGQFAQRARRFIVGQGTADADPRLRVGASVKLQGLGPLFSGMYFVAETRLRFDHRGLRVDFTAERAGLARA